MRVRADVPGRTSAAMMPVELACPEVDFALSCVPFVSLHSTAAVHVTDIGEAGSNVAVDRKGTTCSHPHCGCRKFIVLIACAPTASPHRLLYFSGLSSVERSALHHSGRAGREWEVADPQGQRAGFNFLSSAAGGTYDAQPQGVPRGPELHNRTARFRLKRLDCLFTA